METVLSINLITSNPKVRGGRPCIAGTGLRVTDIVFASLYHDQTPDEIAGNYGVSVAGVHGTSSNNMPTVGVAIALALSATE